MLRRTSNLTATFLFVFLLTAAIAHAGPLTGIVNYIQGNIVGDIITLAIIGIGIALFAHHVSWWLVIGICAGCWILANPQTLASAFTGG